MNYKKLPESSKKLERFAYKSLQESSKEIETKELLYNELPKFSKEFKQLSKRYKSLPDDLEKLKRFSINIAPLGDSKNFNIITRNKQCVIIKTRLHCRSLKGSSLRIIYAFHYQDCRINFIEIYFKGDKVNEDRKRIEKYLKNYSKTTPHP